VRGCCTIRTHARASANLGRGKSRFCPVRRYMVLLDLSIRNLDDAMARAPVMAAGGIVLRREQTPLVAVVRLRKRDEWVLPKGKLDAGETPRAAAEREVVEETGHDVTVHEFLGTLVYETGGRSKIVHYWRMEAGDEQTRELMNDIRAVDWLPLEAAIERLSRASERTFLANVGPQALASFARKARAKPQAARKRRGRTIEAPAPSRPAALSARRQLAEASPLLAAAAIEAVTDDVIEAVAETDMLDVVVSDAPARGETLDVVASESAQADDARPAPQAEALQVDEQGGESVEGRRWSLARKVRDWLGRAA
jgi:8-oxo-dGTP diphosphatase